MGKLIMENWIELSLLFASAFLAATIIPAQSEIVLATMHIKNNYNVYLLVVIASAGNIIGSLINLFLGYYLIKFQNKKWFPVNKKSLVRATNFYQKYGVWSLLLSWVPIIGDPLTVVSGIFRTPIYIFLILISIAKILRYISIVLIV